MDSYNVLDCTQVHFVFDWPYLIGQNSELLLSQQDFDLPARSIAFVFGKLRVELVSCLYLRYRLLVKAHHFRSQIVVFWLLKAVKDEQRLWDELNSSRLNCPWDLKQSALSLIWKTKQDFELRFLPYHLLLIKFQA